MRLGIEFGEGDALPFEVGKVCVLDNLVEVLPLLRLSVPLEYAASRSLKQKGTGGKARRTWFSSHIVMKRSKDRPLSTILNFWPVPSASAGARPARPTSNLYADGIVAACCYGIFGDW